MKTVNIIIPFKSDTIIKCVEKRVREANNGYLVTVVKDKKKPTTAK